MPDLLIRDVSPRTVAAVKRRAERNGRSAAAELRMIVDEAVRDDGHDDWWERVSRLRESLLGRVQGDSAELIREDRDSR